MQKPKNMDTLSNPSHIIISPYYCLKLKKTIWKSLIRLEITNYITQYLALWFAIRFTHSKLYFF